MYFVDALTTRDSRDPSADNNLSPNYQYLPQDIVLIIMIIIITVFITRLLIKDKVPGIFTARSGTKFEL